MAKFKVGDKIKNVKYDGGDTIDIVDIVDINDDFRAYRLRNERLLLEWLALIDVVDIEGWILAAQTADNKPVKHKCHCDMRSLLIQGCKCGGE